MIKKNRTTFANIFILLFGCALFYMGTDGLQAFTAETARVNQLIEEKPTFPDVTLEDSEGRTYPISEFEDKYVFITFIYTACTTVCPQLEMNMAQVYEQIPQEYIGEEIVFLSISFDPTRDDPATLDQYRNYFGSDGETWRMARISNETELQSLLESFGVIVIPDGKGNFAHNSAFYLVDPNGSLIDVMDYREIDQAASKVISILDTEKGE
ncbi:SCO family protein [Bacillus sinesaloumensis]|uniref:SCO family protein n=1 Tax=Litchfieldia sinesaloumensis TaxID=1926280 RepID=UPI00098884A4|nr:SCO family protein [Bacillus sinesaloumensis]